MPSKVTLNQQVQALTFRLADITAEYERKMLLAVQAVTEAKDRVIGERDARLADLAKSVQWYSDKAEAEHRESCEAIRALGPILAFHRLPWYKRAWTTIRGRRPKA